MASSDVTPSLPDNYLLAALPPEESSALLPHLELVSLEIKQPLYLDHEPIDFVYFPHDGVMSLIQPVMGAQPVEIGTVGREGMVGLPVFLGSTATQGTAVCQVPGRAWRIATGDFRRLVRPGTALNDLIHRFMQAFMVLMAQNSACNRRHPVDQRAARWLSMTRDRVSGDTFPLTQEFLGQMLGVRRAGVSEVAGRLQAEGLIRYARGSIEVLDRAGLEARACNCYQVIRGAFEQMLLPN